MRAFILKLIVIIGVFIVILFICNNLLFLGGEYFFSLKIRPLPFDNQPYYSRTYIGPRIGEDYFYFKNNVFKDKPNKYGIVSYCFNRKENILFYTYVDSVYHKTYWQAVDKNEFKQVNKEEIRNLNERGTKRIKNFCGITAIFSFLEFITIIIAIILIFLLLFSLILKKEFNNRTLSNRFHITQFISIVVVCFIVIYFDYRGAPYDSSYFLQTKSSKSGLHIDLCELNNTKFLVSIVDQFNNDIITIGDIIFDEEVTEIKSYIITSDNFWFSYQTIDGNFHYTTIIENNGKWIYQKKSEKQWKQTMKLKESHFHTRLVYNYHKYARLQILSFLIAIIFIPLCLFIEFIFLVTGKYNTLAKSDRCL